MVPVEPGEAEDPQATALAVRLREALAELGTPVLDDTQASELVEERVSAPVSELSESDITTWASSSQAALRALARADYDNAREALVAAQEVAQRAAEELNREAERAREVLDTCLFTARVFLETHQRTEAERQVRSCRVLVPEVEPRRHRHPPEVHALLDRIDAEETNGGLRVTSSPTGCTVRVNGVPQGETPFAVEQLARGDYRLQVECSAEERGRVHLVRIDEGMTEVHVDVGFDRALASRPFPRLTQPDERLAHGRILAAALNTTVIVVAAPNAAHLLRVDPDGSASQVWMRADGDVTAAAEPLRADRSVDLRSGEPESIDRPGEGDLRPRVAADFEVAPDHGSSDPGDSLPSWRLGAGLALLGAGAATFAVSSFLAAKQGSRGRNYQVITDPEYVSPEGDDGFLIRQQAWRDTRTPLLTTAFLGGALLAIGAGMVTPEREGVPWWGWLSGGVGLVLAGVSVALTATANECVSEVPLAMDDPNYDQFAVHKCVDHRQDRATALLLGMSSLPFIAVPISALLQSPDSDTQVSIVPRRGGAGLHVGGSF
ncbi:MAG: PEGA domain-containing protein [Deltaproteobacteria bacterium]|nr:PEGA domain-containing protein [Deltaproteobacteria bacterium]